MSSTGRIAALAALLGLLLPALAHAQADAAFAIAPAQSPTASRALFWDDFWRGWHFYEEPEGLPQAPAKPASPQPEAKRRATRAPELIEFEQLQRRLEEYRNIAIIRPSEDNVRRYMQLEAQVVRQASYFSEVAQRVAWATPDLDMTLQGRPVNSRAIEVFDREQATSRAQSLNDLARTHVLFFFFRSDCPYCHALSPMLAAFSARFGIQIVPISVNGKGLPSFPAFRLDNGIARTLQVTQVPAIYLAEPYTGKITPIGFGVLSESQLIERIATVAAPGADAYAPSITRRVNLQ